MTATASAATGARTLNAALKALRRPQWLRDRLTELENRLQTYEYHHQLALHRIGIAGRDAPADTLQHAQELEQNIADAKAEINCLLLGWRQLKDVSQRVQITYTPHLPPRRDDTNEPDSASESNAAT